MEAFGGRRPSKLLHEMLEVCPKGKYFVAMELLRPKKEL
jgi:hypothetical protein